MGVRREIPAYGWIREARAVGVNGAGNADFGSNHRRPIQSAPAPVYGWEMRYRILILLVLALCLVGVLSACGGGSGGGGGY